MKTIEVLYYERYDWIEKRRKNTMYICVPVTLLALGFSKTEKTQFIFWN